MPMALQPIYGENGEIVDHYDDGLQDQSPTPVEVPLPEQREESLDQQPEEGQGAESPHWRVPDMLKGAHDLFLGTTIHHDDGDPQGPLISLFVRELPDGMIHVKTFRTAELSQRAFLDNLQQAIVTTMQVHFLAWAEQQRKKGEEEAKRKARASQSSTKTPSTASRAPTVTRTTQTASPPSTPSRTSAPAHTSAKPGGGETEKQPEKKYATVSMFD